ncbi:MAG: primosomal protein N' [Dysgonamonadaceae bacterium]|jgi:primosomal protein N' (replication factor Y)|nr:primosomal protein N' [Dysgonamonadaceae bacterium]
MMFIEVILPVPLSDTYTYSVPEEMQNSISPGCLVLVEFGKNKHYSGIIASIHQISPVSDFEIKPILAVESQSILRRPQLRFWEWLSQYYICKQGEVYKAVLPAGFRTESSSKYIQKKETFVNLTSLYLEEDNLSKAFDSLKRAPKQEKLLLAYLEYSQAFSSKDCKEISKKELLEKSGLNDTALNGLVEKGILSCYEKEISRLKTYFHELQPLNQLNPLQQQAYGEIVRSFREKDVCLLHGVTSSGKTEIYIHLINEVLKLNRQALFLLPEIALTSQITTRLMQVFGDKVGVYHSKISNNERVEIWNNLLNDDGYQIILGVRSSIFLPFRDLGLVIVDEEHETSYKQQDPAPRYHARNAAIVLANMHGAKTLLGSATPSLESFHNAQTGKYGYVNLEKRFEDTELPEITVVDIKELKRKKRMKGLFSPLLIEKMQLALNNNEQIILFQNRRGFAPMIYCKICDWMPKCKYCDVGLTYHKKYNQLICHYCGTTYGLPTVCPECGNEEIRERGFGTEKVEEEIKKLFPETKVARMDTDTTRKKDTFEDIISDFEKGKTQILIGTQMISKGLDFGNVSLVGILSADSMMNFPDFRAHERAYQLMAQVAGRAGRRQKRGEVILQTSHPEHLIIQSVLKNDYQTMYDAQMEERQLFRYPPLYRIIEITLKHKSEQLVENAAFALATDLKTVLSDRVLGPDKPVIGKIQMQHLRRIFLKIENSASLSTLRKILEEKKTALLNKPSFKYVVLQYDVDPV